MTWSPYTGILNDNIRFLALICQIAKMMAQSNTSNVIFVLSYAIMISSMSCIILSVAAL